MNSSLAPVAMGFVALSLVLGAIEWRFPARTQKLFRRGYLTDVAYWLFTPLVTRAVTRGAIVVAVVAVALASGSGATRDQVLAFLNNPARLVRQQPLWLQAVEVLTVGDFIGYWIHRCFHRKTLWRFHAIHHSSKDLDWLSAVRLHPVNDVIARLAQVIPIVMLGYGPTVVAAYAPFLGLFAVFLHANVPWDFGPLRRVIASPRFHRFHHTLAGEGLDRNFAGLLPLWDIAFGTFHLPDQDSPQKFGLQDDAVPEGLIGQLIWPLRRTAPSAR